MSPTGDVDMALDALGLKGKADHTLDDTADLGSFPIEIKRQAVLVHRLAR